MQSQLTVKSQGRQRHAAAGSRRSRDDQPLGTFSSTAAVRWAKLERELTLRLPKAAQKTLLVQAVRSVAVEKVVLVLDAAKKLGVGRLGIGVSPEG